MISIVIPAFNSAPFINRTINSVLAQTYKDYELIVVDDGSTDNTAGEVKKFGDRIRYIYQENAGDGPARNTGIKAAKGEWIAFLDHDDEWLPEKLELQMKILSINSDLRWCGANRYRSDGRRRAVVADIRKVEKKLGKRDYFDNFFKAFIEGVCPIRTSTLMIRRDVFGEVGYFTSGWMRCADLDMWWRIAYKYPKIGYISRPLAVLHLDTGHAMTLKLCALTKRGEDMRDLIARHLDLSKKEGRGKDFNPLAVRYLKNAVLSMFNSGYGSDARETVNQFRDLFPFYWRLGTYLLTIFPKVTAKSAQMTLYLMYKIGLERRVSRRWLYSQQSPPED